MQILAEFVKHRTTAVTSEPIQDQLLQHAADRAEYNGADQRHLAAGHQETAVGEHNLTRDDLQGESEQNAPYAQPFNKMKRRSNQVMQ